MVRIIDVKLTKSVWLTFGETFYLSVEMSGVQFGSYRCFSLLVGLSLCFVSTPFSFQFVGELVRGQPVCFNKYIYK